MKLQFLILALPIVMASCSKKSEAVDNPSATASVQTAEKGIIPDANLISWYNGLNKKTIWELQQTRAATARYLNLNNALADGYVDIAVDVENMGHHYMKASLVDEKFDFREPEILVYNKDKKGKAHLVAVEYAVPLNLPRPEGFTGNRDTWTGSTAFSLWLLHAWVWKYNPDGVFNPTNPLIDLH